METHTPKAVFISYASQDVEAARRIADALRGFGIEVWFDQHELRGGDAWDQKIRRQIHECTLFMPVISATTQDRGEGYFRREWHLAIDRTLDLAEGVPFIVPVAVDDVPQSSAAVPELFLSVQWTHLPHGVPSPQFIDQIRQLLEAPRRPAAVAAGVLSGARPDAIPSTPAVERFRLRRALWPSLAAAVVVAVLAIIVWQKPAPTPPKASPSAAAVPQMEKSIAVLPFKNLEEGQDSGLYVDGLHDDVLANLKKIRSLRVISRLSVEQYRATTKSSRQIGEELGVGHVFSGSVHRKDKTVRFSGQLIDARAETIVWSHKYEVDRTEVFALQSNLAEAIAVALQVALSDQEKAALARRSTKDSAAYDLYREARIILGDPGPDRNARAIKRLSAAVRLDAKFTEAWALLSYFHSCDYGWGVDRTEARKREAKAALDEVTRLAPSSAHAIRAAADYHLFCLSDFNRAANLYGQILLEQPNDTEALKQLSAVEHRQGRWLEMLAHVRRYLELEPGDVFVARTLVRGMLLSGRRYAEALDQQRRIVSLRPDDPVAAFALAEIPFLESGTTREIEELFARWGKTRANQSRYLKIQQGWARKTGKFAEWQRLGQLLPDYRPPTDWDQPGWDEMFETAELLATNGDLASARALTTALPAVLRRRLEEQPDNEGMWSRLGVLEALHGHKEEALRCARKAIELCPESRDKFNGPYLSSELAFVYAWTGDQQRALAEYARLLRTPHGTEDVHYMKCSPRYAPLRGDPRFEALLNDPKNNAPLF